MVEPAWTREPEWVSYIDAATLVGRSVDWVRNRANRGEIRREVDPDGRRWLARQDVEQLDARLRVGPDRSMRRRVPSPPPGAVTVVDAARRLQVAYSNVKKLVARGELVVHTRTHPYTYLDQASVEALVLTRFGGHDPDDLMTYTEAATELGTSIQAVRRLVYAGALTPVGTNRRTRLVRDAVFELTPRH